MAALSTDEVPTDVWDEFAAALEEEAKFYEQHLAAEIRKETE